MAIVTFDKKLFEKEIGNLNNKMQESVAMFGTPIEKINDSEVQIEIFPNRPDMLSYQGFKRAFLGFSGKRKGLKEYKVNGPKTDYRVNIDSSVKEIRPYTACAIVKGLKFNDQRIKEVIEIQEKLHLTVGRKRKKLAIGIYPLEKIKLPITYKALEPDKIKFTPLESRREMSGLEILQKHPAGKEYAPLLSGKAKFPIFLDSNKEILSMPPIINSQFTGKITERTRDIFIECSGHDLELLKKGLNIIVSALADMGGKIYQMKLNYGKTPDLKPEKVKISLENTNKLLGLNLNEKQLRQLIEKMGYGYNNGAVEVPAWRMDVLHEVDIIEDVAIAYGYDNFIPEIPKISTIGGEDPRESVKRKISEILAGLGMIEVSNYHLTTQIHQFRKMGVAEKQEKGFIEIGGSKTDYNILRKDLTHYLLRNFSENVDAEYPQKIFGVGKVFDINEKTGEVSEGINLGLAIAPGGYTEIKQILEYLFEMVELNINFKEPEQTPQYFVDGRAAKIILGNKKLGYIGEVHPRILKNWKLKMPVALLEISLEEVFEKLV